MNGYELVTLDFGGEPNEGDAAARTAAADSPRASRPRPVHQDTVAGRFIHFIVELRRRHVARAAIVYGAAAFVVAQAAELIVGGLDLPGGILEGIIVLAIIGFPITLVLAWFFDLTPLGLKRTEETLVRRVADRRSIAALPFANLTSDADDEFFSDGITEEIVSRLATISDLRVISRTSVLRYRNTTQSIRSIAQDLGVSNILEGSVRRSGNHVRITAKLIEAETDTHLWSETYDRELCDIFAVQTDVARHIAEALEANITELENERLDRPPTVNLRAYVLYLKGRQKLERGSPSAIRAAISDFEQAIDDDPDFALAHATLADAYVNLPYWGRAHPRTVYEAARSAVERALRLDPELAEAHTADAAVKMANWDWPGAEAAIARALALTPNSPAPFAWGCAIAGLGERYDLALNRVDQGLARDPHSLLLLGFKGMQLNYANRPAESLAVLTDLIRRAPTYGVGHLYMALTLRSLDRHEEAVASYRLATELLEDHEVALGSMTYSLAKLGRHEEAAGILRDLLVRQDQEWVDPFAIAGAAFANGRIDLGIDELERAEAERSFFLPWIRPTLRLPTLSALRAHPRMQALLARIWPADFGAENSTEFTRRTALAHAKTN